MNDYEAFGIDFEEARKLGLLLEINRRVLHPAGFALSFDPGDDRKLRKSEMVACITRTDDPEGYGFSLDGQAGINSEELASKARAYAGLALDRRAAREKLYGSSIQPIPGLTEEEPFTLMSDDGTIDLCIRLARTAVGSLAGQVDPEDIVESILLRVIGPLFSMLRLRPGNVLVAPEPREEPDAPLDYAQMARARYLARELPRLAQTHEVAGGLSPTGERVAREAETELLPPEVEEANDLAAAVKSWSLTEPPVNAREVLDRMEALFSLAQPGMRFWRGLREDIIERADEIHARLDAYRETRRELDRYLAGELSATALSDPKAIRAELEGRVAPLRTALKALDDERNAILGSLLPVDEALSRLSGEGK